MKEILTLIKAAQKEEVRLVFELNRDGTFRIIVNELGEGVEPSRDYVL